MRKDKISKDSILSLSPSQFESSVESGEISGEAISDLWSDEEVRTYVNTQLKNVGEATGREILSALLQLADKNSKRYSSSAEVRSEAVQSLFATTGHKQIGNVAKELLRGKEDEAYYALATDGAFEMPKVVKYVKSGLIAPPTLDVVERIVADKSRGYKSDRVCLFMHIAFGTEEIDAKRISDILVKNTPPKKEGDTEEPFPQLLMFYALSDMNEDGIIDTDIDEETGARKWGPFLERVAYLDEKTRATMLRAFDKFAARKDELDSVDENSGEKHFGLVSEFVLDLINTKNRLQIKPSLEEMTEYDRRYFANEEQSQLQ